MIHRLGKFEIRQLLGQGAMGEVYLAFDPAIQREVAIKTILPGSVHGGEALARFEREAMAAGKLNHPHIVTIHEFGEDQGILFIAMEYVQGHDLGELLLERSLSRSETLEVLAQVCEGLAYAHRNGVIHRDIKPSNVRVTRDGHRLHAKIVDFGVARMGNSDMTATGTVMGTICYLAPEYIRTGSLDPRSDLFAVGVMLYEALSGRKPFMGDTAPTILYRIVHEPADPIDLKIFDGISPATRSVLDRALAKEPDERFQTGDAFARALRAAKDPTWQGEVDQATSLLRAEVNTTASAPATGAPAPSSEKQDSDADAPKRRPWLLPAGFTLALALVVFGSYALRKSRPPVAPAPIASPAPPAPSGAVPAVPAPPATSSKPVTGPKPALPSVPATQAVAPGAAPSPAPAAIPAATDGAKAIVNFERFNIQADVILDNRERLIIDGKPGDPMRKVITPIAAGHHSLFYEVSNEVRYHADIDVEPGDNYLRPSFQYETVPGLRRNLSYEEGKDNTYTFTQDEDYLTYDAKGVPVQNHGELVLTVKLTKDGQGTLLATFGWKISNRGKELSQGSVEGSHAPGAPRTEGRKILFADNSITYSIYYHVVDNSIQVDLSGSFNRTL